MRSLLPAQSVPVRVRRIGARGRMSGVTAKRLLVLGGCAAFLVLSVGDAFTLDVSSDEGFYAQAARNALSGLLPYRDFGYTQGPVVPYLNGAAMAAAGWGLTSQRLVQAAWGVLGMAALLFLAVRLTDLAAAEAAAAALLLSLHWVENLTLGNTFALGGLFVALAAFTFTTIEAPRIRLASTLALSILAAGCRLSLAPFGLVLAAAVVLEERRASLAALAAALGAAFSLAVYGPFVLASPENTLFWTVRFHLASVVDRRGGAPLLEALTLAPAVALLAAAAAVGLLARPFEEGREARTARSLWAAALATAAANLAVRAPYGGYVTPVAGVLAVASARIAFGAWPARRTLLAGVTVLAAAAGAWAFRPATGPAALADVREAAAFLRAHTAPGARVAGTLPEVALEAGRDVVGGLEMGKFGFTEEMSPEQAARLHLTHADALEAALRDKSVAAVVLSQRKNWNFGWSAPSLRPTRPETLERLRAALDAGWTVGYANASVVVLVPR